MGIPYTEHGYNMYDILSVVQKAVRRGDYELGGWGCNELKNTFRSVMWNRLLITTSEDSYGVLTKEIVALRENDLVQKDDRNIANAMALLCRAKKSRDACYFACNFVIDSRKPREIKYTPEQASDYQSRMKNAGGKATRYDSCGFAQGSLFDEPEEEIETDDWSELDEYGLCLQIATEHRDMDMMGWYLDRIRRMDWDYIWEVYMDYARNHFDGKLVDEVIGLRKADAIFNRNKEKTKRNEIFISKALMIFCYAADPRFPDPRSNKNIQYDALIDWTNIKVKPISECALPGGVIPDFVYDCHTIEGKRRGKTDWDMTRDEQAALHPLEPDYFSDASWLYTYQQDRRNGCLPDKEWFLISEFAKTHPANPVEFIPYD